MTASTRAALSAANSTYAAETVPGALPPAVVFGHLQNVLDSTRTRIMQWWATAAPAVAAARWISTIAVAYTTSERDSAPLLIGEACTGVALSFCGNHTALATDTVTVTVMRAAAGSTTYSDTALTLTIPAGTAAGTLVQDLAHSVAFAAGDRVVLKVVQSGTTAQAAWYARFELVCV